MVSLSQTCNIKVMKNEAVREEATELHFQQRFCVEVTTKMAIIIL